MGVAIGDALGAPVENLTRDKILLKYGKFITKYEDGNKGKRGTFTDDTQMTIILAESLLLNKGFNPDDLAKRFVEFNKSLWNCRRPGNTNTYACINLEKGKRWDESGFNSEGNGSAMRVAPIGLLYHHDLNLLKKYATQQSIITHNNPQAISGSVAIAFSIAYMLNNGPTILTYEFNKENFLDELSDFVEDISMPMSKKINHLKNLDELNYKKTGISGWVMESVPASIFTFVQGPDYFNRSLGNIVNAGGDSDTNGSMFGAISGAFNGIKRIPKDFIDGLENNYKGKDYISQLSKHLYALNQKLQKI